MRRRPLLSRYGWIFLLCVPALAAPDPRTVAEQGLAAWNARDSAALAAVAHPELIRRMRTAQATRDFVQLHPDRRAIPATGSPQEVVALFCDALREFAPHPRGATDPANHFLGIARKRDGGAVLTFDRVKKHGEDFNREDLAVVVVVLEQEGEAWKFLWLPSAQVHIDLTWDPTN